MERQGAVYTKPKDNETRALHVPIRGREVDRLAAVEAIAETAVIGLRKGDDEVASALCRLDDRDLVVEEHLRINLRRDVVLKVGHLLEPQLHQLFHHRAELGRLDTRDTIPLLGGAHMVVVDRGEVDVLAVPAEGRE